MQLNDMLKKWKKYGLNALQLQYEVIYKYVEPPWLYACGRLWDDRCESVEADAERFVEEHV